MGLTSFCARRVNTPRRWSGPCCVPLCQSCKALLTSCLRHTRSARCTSCKPSIPGHPEIDPLYTFRMRPSAYTAPPCPGCNAWIWCCRWARKSPARSRCTRLHSPDWLRPKKCPACRAAARSRPLGRMIPARNQRRRLRPLPVDSSQLRTARRSTLPWHYWMYQEDSACKTLRSLP